MVTGLAEAGTLVTIVKALFDITKTGIDIRGKRAKQATVTIEDLKARILRLHDLLDSCATLGRLVPDWLTRSRRFNVAADQLDDKGLYALRADLQAFIAATHYDSFSSAFFQVRHNVLPGISDLTAHFQQAFSSLDEEYRRAGPPLEISVFREKWPAMLLRMCDMQSHAQSLAIASERINAELLAELKAASAVSGST
jgi:hypothetical protein